MQAMAFGFMLHRGLQLPVLSPPKCSDHSFEEILTSSRQTPGPRSPFERSRCTVVLSFERNRHKAAPSQGLHGPVPWLGREWSCLYLRRSRRGTRSHQKASGRSICCHLKDVRQVLGRVRDTNYLVARCQRSCRLRRWQTVGGMSIPA